MTKYECVNFFLVRLLVVTNLVCVNCFASPVHLKPGFNKLDLNHDGIKDTVVRAVFDNNTSHPNLGLTFFVNSTSGEQNIVPVANSNIFTWFDFRLSAAADFLVQDIKLYVSERTYYIVKAQKKSENLYDPAKVEMIIYRFNETRDDPGVPVYDWVMNKKILSAGTYQSAEEALLELKYVDFSK